MTKNELLFLFKLNPKLKLYNTEWRQYSDNLTYLIEYIYLNGAEAIYYYHLNKKDNIEYHEPATSCLNYNGKWLEWK